MFIITFANSKGGVGKSTSCVAIGAAWAKAGKRVHIVDLDGNKTVSRWLADETARPSGLSVSSPDPQLLTEHLQEIARHYAPDYTLIDIAGSYERALTHAVARAHLILIPACTTEADIFEAARIARHIETIYAAFGKTPLFRVLATRVAPLVTHVQAHGFREIKRLKLPLLQSILAQRAAYEEIGIGLAPHFADPKRPTTAKARAELDHLTAEIDRLLAETYGETSSSPASLQSAS